MNPANMKVGALYKMKLGNIAIYEGVDVHRLKPDDPGSEFLKMRHVGARGKLFWINREAVVSEIPEIRVQEPGQDEDGGPMIPPADRYQFQVELYCGKSRKEAEAWSTLRFEAASFSDAEEQAIRYFACDWHVTEIRKLHKVVDGKWEDD